MSRHSATLSEATNRELAAGGFKPVLIGKGNNGGIGMPGYFTSKWGITKTDAQKKRLQELARASRNRKLAYLKTGNLAGWKKLSAAKMRAGPTTETKLLMAQQRGLNAISQGLITQQEMIQAPSTSALYRLISSRRSLYMRDPKTGKFTRDPDGNRVINKNEYLNASNAPTRASAYDIARLTGKKHTKRIARYLSFLGPQSVMEFVDFDSQFYKDANTITQDEIADFVDYSIKPFESTKAGIAALQRRGKSKALRSDIASLQLALLNTRG